MDERYEVVRVRRADESVVPKAMRFEDGRIFVPGCRIEEGDRIEVDGETRIVVSATEAEFRGSELDPPSSPFSSMLEQVGEGCVLVVREESG